ncbi:phosphoenolpyruvate synthase [Erythrobacter sp. AP23]|uniref:phosphoenolpyruvate synthase n=1 Tax=Erythrobacter sp. AP23 TaxID=499656 RepID=UPI00076CF7A9|nr:phosphoenolpyruvate synthase [Erythrobacter sp. AP23]KWV93759.1 phosphoenolpyruvate synthase [Erythrobacter sp. AP23]
MSDDPIIYPFEALTREDTAKVGGKNASLGEMIGALAGKGIRVPPGFATSAAAYRAFLGANDLDEVIAGEIANYQDGRASLSQAGAAIRSAILAGEWPEPIADAILAAYRELDARDGSGAAGVAVRSSATAEDLPDASFAGQQETFLNIVGEDALLGACKRCFASLYTDRAIVYRELKSFEHSAVALSVGVQRMIRSDRAGAGVMFSIDTETGFDRVVLINAAWGLGESVVQGSIEPDEYHVFKPLLEDRSLCPIIKKRCGAKQRKLIYSNDDSGTRWVDTSEPEQHAAVLEDEEILTLARWAAVIERHYGCPMDIEWAKNGRQGELFIVQARPETVQAQDRADILHSSKVLRPGPVLVEGQAIGSQAATGSVCVISGAAEIDRFVDGSVLVTGVTDPDWVPVMKRAAAIVTDHGGRTSHAAIVSRELGVPAIVGCGNATEQLQEGQKVTVNCTAGEHGLVHEGRSEIREERIDLSALPATRTRVMLNLADPGAAYRWWKLPSDGVGLTRMEFVISNLIKVHPMALLQPERIADPEERAAIERLTRGHRGHAEFYVDRLSRGLARIAALQYPHPVVIRFSDFKTNEYADLLGGRAFEPEEENPMLGFRGASRYASPLFREGFALECRAIRHLRETMGFTNVVVMVPFCRTIDEADRVLAEMAANGLARGQAGLEVLVMCEVPSNVVLAGDFAERFDGFSIGSNDLTQLVLGIDRDSELLAEQFDARDAAVMWMIRHVISEAHAHDTPVGLCGQAPSDHPAFAEFLVECGIDSISVTPDSFVAVKNHVAAAEGIAKVEPAIAQ